MLPLCSAKTADTELLRNYRLAFRRRKRLGEMLMSGTAESERSNLLGSSGDSSESAANGGEARALGVAGVFSSAHGGGEDADDFASLELMRIDGEFEM